MGRNAFLHAAVLLMLAGCSAERAGSVVMKISTSVAHVELPPSSVRVGDRVALIESYCPGKMTRRTRKPMSDKCRKVVIGTGSVTEILNDRYSVAEFPNGPEFEEGDAVDLYRGQPVGTPSPHRR